MEPLKARLKDFETSQKQQEAKNPEPETIGAPALTSADQTAPLPRAFCGEGCAFGHPISARCYTSPCRNHSLRRWRPLLLSNLSALSELTLAAFRLRGRRQAPSRQTSLRTSLQLRSEFYRLAHRLLLLTGTYGSGKTHASATIASQAVGMGISTLFLTVPDLLGPRAAFLLQPSRIPAQASPIRTAPLMVSWTFRANTTSRRRRSS